ncbi:hypothetical protein OAP20_08490 [Alphaproteobacteria bacterium]|nr:hypothetical protein [Alphaproteobacteria bacterium]
MKKNIILIDLHARFYNSIYKSKKVNIELLISDVSDDKLEKIKDLYGIKNIITRAQFHDYTVQKKSDMNYETIHKFKTSQLNSEHFQDRLSNDSNLKQYHYFNALSFWIDFFTKNNISAVVLDGLMHGANYDSLALDVAKTFGVSVYVVESHMRRRVKDKIATVRSVFDYNLKKRIPIDCSKLKLTSIDVNNYLFSADNISLFKKKNIKGIVKSFLPSYAPTIMLMLKYILHRRSIHHHGLTISPFYVLNNIYYVKKMRKFYDSVSVEFDASKKYVFYAMHFEPEANIMARASFSNQLIVIKQLSQNLPKGWVLFVKEHPDQFELNKQGWWYFLISIHKYRTKEFYKELLKLNNVSLLKWEVKSKNIIKSAEAISTINGSIALEALSYNKSLILFGHQSIPFGLCKDVFKVESSEQCKKTLERIEGGFIPDYSDFVRIVDNYLFELKRVPQNDVQLLVDYLVCEYKAA